MPSTPEQQPAAAARRLLLAAGAYSALTIALTWPLVLHLGTAVPHDAEDPLLSAALLWWNAHVLPLTARWLDGFYFYPGGGALTFSDHRLGLMPIAAPLQWIGVSPIATYNIVLLLTYPLCALAAHLLARALTSRDDAAIVCGLAFGFSPYRVEHIPHLELLAAFGMPAALWALHRFRETRRTAWLLTFAAALVVQGLCASYYLLFFFVFLGLWVLWFARVREWRHVALIGVATAGSVAVLSPLAVEYLRVHERFGLSRSYSEVVAFSADVTSLFTASSLVAVWGWTARFNGNENRTFLGATILVVIAAALVQAVRRRPPAAVSRPSLAFLAVAGVFLGLAILTAIHGPWRFSVGPIAASGSVPYKPLSVALLMLAVAIAWSSRARAAYRTRSAFAFYLVAALVLIVCSFGPQPRFMGRQFLYEPPYGLLMHLPVFDRGVRAPARFAMPAALAVSVAAALAFARLTAAGSRAARVGLAVVATGIVVDTFVPGMPLAPVPDGWSPARAAGFAAVLELPLGGTGEDVSAMYRASAHGRPTINGYSGYDPPHYVILRAALQERDDTALDAIAAAAGPLLVVADTAHGDDWTTFAAAHRGSTPLGTEHHWVFFSVPRGTPPPQVCNAAAVPIAAAAADGAPIPLAAITDGNRFTWWTPGHAQQSGDRLQLDLGVVARPCAVTLSQTGFGMLYPRALDVATSVDGERWTPAFSGPTAGLMVSDALAHEANPQLKLPLTAAPARWIRLTVSRTLERDPWVVTDVTVRGLSAPR